MANIIYEEGNEELLDAIQPLWEKLNEEHRQLSKHFSDVFLNNNFDKRKRGLLELAKTAQIRVDLVKDSTSNQYIGYCVSTVDQQKVGEIESLFVEESYRGLKIGDMLMKKSLSWMDQFPTVKKVIKVAYGNEKVFSFYNKYGFFPRSYTFEQIENK